MMDMLLTVIFWGVLLGAFVLVIAARAIIDEINDEHDREDR